MRSFFILSKNVSSGLVELVDKAAVHHIKDVLRVKAGEEVKVFDERGDEYICAAKELFGTRVILEIKHKQACKMDKLKITIACALPKKAKFDDIVDKLTQLGVDRVIPLKTKRVIVRLTGSKEAGRLTRWRKIAQSASGQSQRNTIPVISEMHDFKEALSEAKNFDLKLIPALIGERRTLREALSGSKAQGVFVLIGPEGDFTGEEVALATQAGFIPVTLGPLVLRVDTACIAVASILSEWGRSQKGHP